MISNERPSPFGPDRRSNQPPKAPLAEDLIRADKIQVERKTFLLSLKENPRGRFLRITEDCSGRHDTIMVPATGLEEFSKAVAEMAKASAEMPEKGQ